MLRHLLLAVALCVAMGHTYAEPAVGFTHGATAPSSVVANLAAPPLDPAETMTEEDPHYAIHQELRALLGGISKAINTQQYGDLKQYFQPTLHITTINQNIITTPEGIEAYFNEWFGAGGYLKSLHITLDADAPTALYGQGKPSWGVVYGTGLENYALADGRHLDLNTRWTATVSKGDDGKWRILTLHIGTNFYDNPIFSAVKNSTKYYALGGLALGLLLGALGVRFWERKKSLKEARNKSS